MPKKQCENKCSFPCADIFGGSNVVQRSCLNMTSGTVEAFEAVLPFSRPDVEFKEGCVTGKVTLSH